MAPTPPLRVAQAQEAQVLVALPDQGAQAQADPQALAAATAEAEVVEKKSRGQSKKFHYFYNLSPQSFQNPFRLCRN